MYQNAMIETFSFMHYNKWGQRTFEFNNYLSPGVHAKDLNLRNTSSEILFPYGIDLKEEGEEEETTSRLPLMKKHSYCTCSGLF